MEQQLSEPTSSAAERVENFREHLQQVTEGISSIESGQEVAIQAVLVDQDSAQEMPLGLFIGPDAQNPEQIRLVDLTPGASRIDYEGRDAEAALNAFERGNSYPQGRIALEIPANDHGIPATERLLETHGRSDLRQASGNLGLASLGFGALAIGAAFVLGAQVAVPYLAGLSLAAGGVASGLSIADELRQTDPSELSIAVDVLGLASSIVGGAATFQAIRQGTAVTVASRSGRYLIYSGFALDGGATLLISVEGVEQINRILNVEGMTPTQKADAIARIVGMLAAQGALLAVGSQDLRTGSGDGLGGSVDGPDSPNRAEFETPDRVASPPVTDINPPRSVPTRSRQRRLVAEITTLTNVDPEIASADVLSRYNTDAGFSGVYDPTTGQWIALASGDASLVNGDPIQTVSQFGGHGEAERALVARTGATDTSRNVGFVLIWQGNNTLRIRWNSGTINLRNFGDRAAPTQYRENIRQVIETTTTGATVIE